MPIMVKSDQCVLNTMSSTMDQILHSECKYDPGGYFIINGSEKVVIAQERANERTVSCCFDHRAKQF